MSPENAAPMPFESDARVPPFSLVHAAETCRGEFVYIGPNAIMCEKCKTCCILEMDPSQVAYVRYDPVILEIPVSLS